jgi:hypothetical protein
MALMISAAEAARMRLRRWTGRPTGAMGAMFQTFEANRLELPAIGSDKTFQRR